MNTWRVLVVGCGNMGTAHAKAYQKMPETEVVGLVSRKPESRQRLAQILGEVPTFGDFETAMRTTRPDIVSINTYPETHADLAKKSLLAGKHVFVEKPLATTVEDARELVQMATKKGLKMAVGYILRVHPAWEKFVTRARQLGKPLVLRMNLNQQSFGKKWETHKALMKSMSPIVDCGVHYVDMMCLMTQSRPVSVNAIGARLTDEIAPDQYNYGQLQVRFEDGSVGWYEAGWGPMMSEEAFFIKDVIGPKGSVSISDRKTDSPNIEGHTKTGGLRLHFSTLSPDGSFARKDEWVDTSDEPDHDTLCLLEQQFLLRAIREDLDLSQHLNDAVNSLKIVLAADRAFRTGQTVYL